MDKLDGLTPDLVATRIDELKTVFPEVFKEGKVDFNAFQSLLGESIEDSNKNYSFTWFGKTDAEKLAQKRSTGTLRPSMKESVNFDTTQNLYIEGDNLEVLKLLSGSYMDRVKMIYIDPPYNTGHDFIYNDNFADSIENYKKIIGEASKSNPETAGRYHTNWLNMMYPRLKLARVLLKEEGVIFISIDDNEVHNLRKVCDEVFGEENFIAQIVVQINPRGRHLDRYVAKTHEYVVVYCKSYESANAMIGVPKEGKMIDEYNCEDELGKYRPLGLRNRNQSFNPTTRPTLYYPLYVNSKNHKVSSNKDDSYTDEVWPDTPDGIKTCWTWASKKVDNENDLIIAEKTGDEWRIFRKDYLLGDDGKAATTLIKSLWTENEMNNDHGRKVIKELFGTSIMDFPKSVDLIKRAITAGTKKDSIILDFFSGSATTAHAVLQLNEEDNGNRQFIMVQLPEACDENSEEYKVGYKNICEIGKERIRRAGMRIKEEYKQQKISGERAIPDLGFKVFKLDTSNLRKWDNSFTCEGDSIKSRVLDYYDNLMPGRTQLDMVYEIMIKCRRPLTSPIKEIEVNGVTAHIVSHSGGGECHHTRILSACRIT